MLDSPGLNLVLFVRCSLSVLDLFFDLLDWLIGWEGRVTDDGGSGKGGRLTCDPGFGRLNSLSVEELLDLLP